MLTRSFQLGQREIELKWDESEMSIYEHGRLIDKISNTQRLNNYRTHLTDGSELTIEFRFTSAHSSLNLYVDGQLLEGSSKHYMSRINIYSTLYQVVGMIFILFGIGYLVENKFLEESNLIIASVDLALGVAILYFDLNKSFLAILTSVLFLMILISYLLLNDGLYQNLLTFGVLIVTVVAISDFNMLDKAKSGNKV